MELPNLLKLALEQEVIGLKENQLIQDAQTISKRYRTESGQGKRLLTQSSEAIAYAVARMPATLGAVETALSYALEEIEDTTLKIETLLDVGAGTGAASWAALELLDLKEIVCLEREEAMRHLGKDLMKEGQDVLHQAKWLDGDLIKGNLMPKADLVISSYVLNELNNVERLNAAQRLWDATRQMLLIVEPGTPAGYKNLKAIRQHLLTLGAHIVAPCPHEEACPMQEGTDWCHFSCRIARSHLHRELKGGEAPYEDEKFAYMAFARQPCHHASARILRHPIKETGKVTLSLCDGQGIETRIIRKKEHDLFKKVHKAKWGDCIE